MSRSPQIPHGAVILRSYAELAAEADAFFGDYYDEVLVIGPPGVGKSETFRQRARKHPERCYYFEGNTKPLATYMECWRHMHKLLTFDDAEGLWASENGRHLMRQLTQRIQRQRDQVDSGRPVGVQRRFRITRELGHARVRHCVGTLDGQHLECSARDIAAGASHPRVLTRAGWPIARAGCHLTHFTSVLAFLELSRPREPS